LPVEALVGGVLVFSFPTVKPVTKLNMNYASVITVGVMFVSLVWYFAGARRHYKGPTSNLRDHHVESEGDAPPVYEKKGSDDAA